MEDGPTVRRRPMTIVIADATLLIYLAAIGRFDLLGVMYGRLLIPDAVYDEVVLQGAGRPVPPRLPGLPGSIGKRSATRRKQPA